MLSLGNVNLKQELPTPGDLAAVTWLYPLVGGHQQLFQKGHIFTHHPKKVTSRIARQVFFWDDYDSNLGFEVDNYQDVWLKIIDPTWQVWLEDYTPGV